MREFWLHAPMPQCSVISLAHMWKEPSLAGKTAPPHELVLAISFVAGFKSIRLYPETRGVGRIFRISHRSPFQAGRHSQKPVSLMHCPFNEQSESPRQPQCSCPVIAVSSYDGLKPGEVIEKHWLRKSWSFDEALEFGFEGK
jgi:hypothetical protein